MLLMLILLAIVGIDIAAVAIAGKITKKENNKTLKRPDLIEVNREDKRK